MAQVTRVGGDIQVNGGTESAPFGNPPSIVRLADGTFLTFWTESSATGDGSGASVRMQRLDAAGMRLGEVTLINTTTLRDQVLPEAVLLPNGNVLVAWSDTSLAGGDASGASIKAQLIAPTGTKIGAEFLVNTTVQNAQTAPDLTLLGNGNVLATWTDNSMTGGDTSAAAIRAQVLSADGAKVGPEMLVNTQVLGPQNAVKSATLTGGGVVVTWNDTGGPLGNGAGAGIRAALFAADGRKIGGEFPVNSEAAGTLATPAVAALDDGGFIVTWVTRYTANGPADDIKAQRFAADGTPVGGEFLVNTPGGQVNSPQSAPSVTLLDNGDTVIAWVDAGYVEGGAAAATAAPTLRGQLYSPEGHAIGGEFSAAAQGATEQLTYGGPALVALGGNRFAIAGAVSAIVNNVAQPRGEHARLFEVTGQVTGTPGDDTLAGTPGDDVVVGRGGRDTIDAGAGNDLVEGGAGDDTIEGGAGNDQLYGGDGADTLTDVGGFDTMDGGAGDDVLTDRSGASGRLIGGDGDDQLFANATVDGNMGPLGLEGGDDDDRLVLTGTPGFAILDGGAGDDMMTVNVSGNAARNSLVIVDGGDGADTAIIDGLGSAQLVLYSGRGDVARLNAAGKVNVSGNPYTGQGRIEINPTVKLTLEFTNFIAGEAGGRLDLSAYGADPFGSGLLAISQNGVNVVITHAATGSTYQLDGARLGDLSAFNLGVATGQFAPLGRSIDDGPASDPTANAPGVLYGADAADVLRGFGGDDELYGAGGNDRLEGGTGFDYLDGGSGADTMVGGADNDIYIVDDLADVVIEVAGEGLDTVFTSQATYALPDNVEAIVYTGTGAARLLGNAGDNVLTGSGSGDLLDLSQGGSDAGFGGDGDDGFFLGGALDAGDRLDGGGGTNDQLGLRGDYATGGQRVLGAGNLIGIETLALLSGADTRFGGNGADRAGYDLKSVDANVAAGAELVVTAAALRAGENLTFDGSAESDGSFLFYGGLGNDVLTGGAGDDVFVFGANGRFGAGDRIDGGAGTGDRIGLVGSYTVAFGADQLKNVEVITAISSTDAKYGEGGLAHVDLTLADGNVAAGRTVTVDAAGLVAGETIRLDASAEHDGRIIFLGGRGDDTIVGSAGNDRIVAGLGTNSVAGGLGADLIELAGGTDTLVYAAGHSTGSAYDTVLGFDFASDRINVADVAGGYHRDADAALSGGPGTLDEQLTAALANGLTAHGAAFVTDAGGATFLVVDQDGTAGYAAGVDLVVRFDGAANLPIDGVAFLV